MTPSPDDPIPLSQRHARSPEGWRAVLDYALTYRSSILGFIGALVFITGFFWYIWFNFHSEALRNEAKTAPLQNDTAEVVSKSSGPLSKTNMTTHFFLTFRIQGHISTLMVENQDKWVRTQAGATVPVTYRVGKTGLYYVEDWQPNLPTPPLTRVRTP